MQGTRRYRFLQVKL
uniref:Uncharacterized protein n=1 Tax=Rhizophora mucronata TaxID=61149 RepID=A0A2P2R1X6_RHIMU